MLPGWVKSSPYCFYLDYNGANYFDTGEGRTSGTALMDWAWSVNGYFRHGSGPDKIGRFFWVSTAIDEYEYTIYQIKKGRIGSLYSFILDINGDMITGQDKGKSPRDALINWLSKKDFGQEKVGEIILPEQWGEGMWRSSFLIGEMLGVCSIVLTDCGLQLIKTEELS
jgi:hypothetical protein